MLFIKEQLLNADEIHISEENECQKLLECHEISKEKWIALSLFCALAFTQSYIWNTWSPITESVMIAFPTWSKGSISLLSDWACISYLLCCYPCCWILYKKGLLYPIKIAALLTTLATIVRCIFLEEFIFTILVHIAAVLNGISGVIIGSATALVSAVWFPKGQRTTATGISYAVNQMGVAISYIIGPAFVKTAYKMEINNHNINNIYYLNKSIIFKHNGENMNLSLHKVELQNQIMSLMRIEFVIQLLLLCGILWFFPKYQLYQYPSSTKYNNASLFKSILTLTRLQNVWILCLVAALSHGTTSPWLNMITTIFSSNMSQYEADNLAFWTVILSSILSLILSRIMDYFQGRLKIAINLMLALSTLMFIWILLIENEILIFQKKELYTAVILGIAVCWSTSAFFLEFASELAFPISEAIVGGYMIFFINIVGCLFYMLQFIPTIKENWSTSCVLGNLIVSTFLLFCVKDEYNCSKIDVLEDNCAILFNKKSNYTLINSSNHFNKTLNSKKSTILNK